MDYKKFLFISLFILSSCSLENQDTDTTKQIADLQKQVADLKLQNANLTEELNLARQGGQAGDITVISGASLFPDGSTFEEGNYDVCMKHAYDDFITLGNSKCKELKYTETDIAQGKCKLTQDVIKQMQANRTTSEGQCKDLYNPQ